MMKTTVFSLVLFSLGTAYAQDKTDMAEHHHHHHMHHDMDDAGMVMNGNKDRLPDDCKAISEEVNFTVEAGVKYARRGKAFGFSQHEWKVKPCARINVTLDNKDEVRHQWMVHGLPKYIYQQGMFHLEANGGHKKTGTLIVPSNSKTYLVHCDIAQHMEKGMKGQLKVAGGDMDLSSIPGITGERYPDPYPVKWSALSVALSALIGIAGVFIAVLGMKRWQQASQKQMTAS